MENIRVIVAEVKKEHPDNGGVFFDAWIEGPNGLTRAMVGGRARGLRPGDCLAAQGDWHAKMYRGQEEKTFRATKMLPDMPTTAAGVERFLRTVFPVTRFGIPADRIADLAEEPGILARLLADPKPLVMLAPPDRRSAVLDEWNARTQGGRAASLMAASGIDAPTAQRILMGLPQRPFDALHHNPYQVAALPKVGFSAADRIGGHIGIAQDDRRRLSAAIGEVLRQEEGRGSTAANLETLVHGSSEVGRLDRKVLQGFLADAARRRDHDIAIYDTPAGPVAAQMRLYIAEADIVGGLARMLGRGRRNAAAAARTGAERLFALPKFSRFDAVQRAAVEMAATEPFSVITGGPGTGKSTVMEVVAKLCKTLDPGVLLLAAPTGKAAKRLGEATGRRAQTVHKLLKAKGGRNGEPTTFGVNADNPLPAGCMVVIDEASMLDATIMAALLNAMPPDGRLLLVGDDGQLPSVGPGAVLADLLRAEIDGRLVVPSIKLVEVYRQAHDSGIAKGAALIREGVTPELDEEDRAGVSFLERADRQLVDEVERIVLSAPAMGLDPLRDVSVLAPQTTGPGGTWQINTRLSQRLNFDGEALAGVFRTKADDPLMPVPRAGDRVMLTENDDDNDVMNGDLGILVGPGEPRNGRPTLRVEFDSGPQVDYLASDWRKLILAYAGTIHKSQGSQYQLVVMPVAQAHKRMLDRQLIYTGWTRAQKKLVLVGSQDALVAGVANAREGARMTLLRSLIAALHPQRVFRPEAEDWASIAREAQKTLPSAIAAAAAAATRLLGARPPFPARRVGLFGTSAGPAAAPVSSPTPSALPSARMGLFGGRRAAASAPSRHQDDQASHRTQGTHRDGEPASGGPAVVLPARGRLFATLPKPPEQPSLPMAEPEEVPRDAPLPPSHRGLFARKTPQPAAPDGTRAVARRPATGGGQPPGGGLPASRAAGTSTPRQGRLFGPVTTAQRAVEEEPEAELSVPGPRF